MKNNEPVPAGYGKAVVERKPSERKRTDGETPMLQQMEDFLKKHYLFRYNRLTETTEFRGKRRAREPFRLVGQRELNTFCLDAQRHGLDCWDRDIARYVHSERIPSYHPFHTWMNGLPSWDGTDRVDALAQRVSDSPLWVESFHRWMLGLAAQWEGRDSLHANSVAPVLVSRRQGMHKSTFCRMLVPPSLQGYYTDSFDPGISSGSEQKLTAFGLINIDELDKLSDKKMALLKNLMQMAKMNIRKAHKKNFDPLPRLASFIATSNRKDLLTDPTGSRRFLCVEVKQKIDCSPIDYEQLYAQLKSELSAGVRHWFTTEEETAIMENNAPFRRQGMEEDVFHRCFRFPESGEKGELLSAACIFDILKRTNPSAMREVTAYAFSRLLPAIGAPRVHTKHGNLYHLIPLHPRRAALSTER
ncbi:MAG: DUF3874 domain-containing protein [Tannerellaceae bacterium]|nr:DUF3874 domain-containing protein [Tannerellaceae bacterium]